MIDAIYVSLCLACAPVSDLYVVRADVYAFGLPFDVYTADRPPSTLSDCLAWIETAELTLPDGWTVELICQPVERPRPIIPVEDWRGAEGVR